MLELIFGPQNNVQFQIPVKSRLHEIGRTHFSETIKSFSDEVMKRTTRNIKHNLLEKSDFQSCSGPNF